MFSLASITGVFGAWVIKGLLKIGVTESGAGKFVASRIFGPLLVIALVAGAVGVGWVVLKVHDSRIRTAATTAANKRCDADKAAMREAQLQRQIDAKDAALAQKERGIRDRDIAITDFETENKRYADENAKLRAAMSAPGRRVLDADDPWLRGANRPAGKADAGARR